MGTAAAEERARVEVDNEIWTPASIGLLITESRELIPVLRKEHDELLRRKRVRFEDGGYPRESWEEMKRRLMGGSDSGGATADAPCAGGRKRARGEDPSGESDAAKRARRLARFAAPQGAAPRGAAALRGEIVISIRFDQPGFSAAFTASHAGASVQPAAPRQTLERRNSRCRAEAAVQRPQSGRFVRAAAPSACGGAEARRRRMQRFGIAP
eukprot:TRINITY_DN21238_c0_g1_i5.p1 TRINITY_DN21238_c0_g1~~TRINITY_DN21238_c0_g1_i5.p1  ORF type:complete len:237 (+),score=56.74 TRINITY_DN21238_c0_g1_i5:76-711(+)